MVAGASSLDSLLFWRVVQGIGGAFCAVSVPAIVRDQVHGQDAARLFGLIGLIMFIAPAAAPSLGAAMLALGDWHLIFVFLTAYAALLALVLKFVLFRRLPPRERVKTPLRTLVTNYGLVLRHATTMRFIGLQVLCFSVMLVFITHASFIYQEWFGLSNGHFAGLYRAGRGLHGGDRAQQHGQCAGVLSASGRNRRRYAGRLSIHPGRRDQCAVIGLRR